MNEATMLRGAEPRKILQTVVEKKTPAIMSYLSVAGPPGRRKGCGASGKWRVAKVLLTNLGASILNIEVLSGEKPRPINVQVNQSVGISLKYGYGKIVFDTTVVGLEPLPDPTRPGWGGMIVLAVPDRIELVQKRSYFRVAVPRTLKVSVVMWHRRKNRGRRPVRRDPDEPRDYWQGRLVDISAGGAQIAVDAAEKPHFKKGQFIGLRFTPMPYEMPLMFNAQIRDILPTADDKNICLGVQIVGLEASPEGRGVLRRLCDVAERYYQINQSSVKQQDMQPAEGGPDALSWVCEA